MQRNIWGLAIVLAGVALRCASPAAVPTTPAQLVDPIIIEAQGVQPKQLAREGLRVPSDLVGEPAVVDADVHVSASGEVVQTVPVSGHPSLHASLQTAARAWRFAPLIVDGRTRSFVLPLRVSLSWSGGSANIKMAVRDPE